MLEDLGPDLDFGGWNTRHKHDGYPVRHITIALCPMGLVTFIAEYSIRQILNQALSDHICRRAQMVGIEVI